VAIISGRPAASQCASALAAQASFQRVPAHHNEIERAVFVVGHEQPSRVSRLASRAPSQRIAGRAASISQDRPTANGISTTTSEEQDADHRPPRRAGRF